MEAFTLLKYWKGGGIGGSYSDGVDTRGGTSNVTTTTMVDDNSDGGGDDDDGGFFDLEFPEDEVVVLDEKETLESGAEVVLFCSEETVEEGNDEVLSLSASENGSQVVVTVGSEGKTPLLMKPAAKLKFLISGLKKLPALPPLPALQLQQRKQKPREMDTNEEKVNDNNNSTAKKKIFTDKFNVDEVPFVSLFIRDTNGSRSSDKREKVSNTLSDTTTTASEEQEEEVENGNNYSKDVMRKYLSKIKPLYIRVSKKYIDKVPVVSSEQSIDSSDDTKTNQEQQICFFDGSFESNAGWEARRFVVAARGWDPKRHFALQELI